MSTSWAILGIERTADTRLIKRAYAKKLKQTRPDEQPEAFQQLHFAYKSALQEASWLAARAQEPALEEPQTDDRDPAESDQNRPDASDAFASAATESDLGVGLQFEYREPPPNIEFAQPAVEYTVEPQPFRCDASDDQLEIDRILRKAEAVLFSDAAHDADAWRFVLESTHILDQAFLDRLGLALLRRITRYFNQEEFIGQGDFGIDVEVLHYLNSVFRWDRYEDAPDQYLQNKHGERLFKRIAHYSGKTQTGQRDITSDLRGAKYVKKVIRRYQTPLREYYYGNGMKRVTALAIDLAIATLLTFAITLLIDKTIGLTIAQIERLRIQMPLATYLVAAWLLESSRYQATPGKKALGLRVTTRNQGRLGYFHGLLRIAIFAVSCIGSWITLLINAQSGGHFLHDRISRSCVIDLWLSYKEQEKA